MFYSILGDSVSTYEGFNPRFYPVFYGGEQCRVHEVYDVEDTWWDRVIAARGGTLLVNSSWSGCRVSGRAFPAGSSVERTHTLGRPGAEPDTILIYMGWNDFAISITPRGEPDDPYTFYGGCRRMLSLLREAYPRAELCFGTLMTPYIRDERGCCFPEFYRPPHPLAEYNEVIRQVCAELCVRCIELGDGGFESLDGTHPTGKGHGELAAAWLRAL